MRTLLALLACSAPAAAQSFNIEWGTPGTGPSPTHAAEGLAGVWNTLGNMVPVQQYPLVGLDGQPTAAYIFQVGFDTIQSFHNPATSGDDQALLDDCYTSFNDPLDGCLFIRNIEPGDYRVVMYGLAPDDASLLSRLRIDQNPDDAVLVGGAWTGVYEEGITHMTQLATVGTDGRLDVHSGLPSGNIRSVLNAIQIVRVKDECPADLAEPFGTLNFFDVAAYIQAYGAADPIADLAEPFGSFNFFDVSAYIQIYNAGCP